MIFLMHVQLFYYTKLYLMGIIIVWVHVRYKTYTLKLSRVICAYHALARTENMPDSTENDEPEKNNYTHSRVKPISHRINTTNKTRAQRTHSAHFTCAWDDCVMAHGRVLCLVCMCIYHRASTHARARILLSVKWLTLKHIRLFPHTHTSRVHICLHLRVSRSHGGWVWMPFFTTTPLLLFGVMCVCCTTPSVHDEFYRKMCACALSEWEEVTLNWTRFAALTARSQVI